MIDEHQEEQASLYVAGALNAEETQAFEQQLRGDAELQTLVAALRVSADALAGSVPRVNPPAALKRRIMDELDRREKIVPLAQPGGARGAATWFPWALAACLAILCTVEFAHESNLNAQISQMTAMADSLQQTNVSLASAAESWKQKAELANLHIAMLDSLVAEAPKTTAVAVWNDLEKNGVFIAKNLKQLPQGRDYELWVFDGEKPVAAGLLTLDPDGNVRMKIDSHAPVKNASKFAVTDEPAGGGEAPRGAAVLAGG